MGERVEMVAQTEYTCWPIRYLVTRAHDQRAEAWLLQVMQRHGGYFAQSIGLLQKYHEAEPHYTKGPTASIFIFPESTIVRETSVLGSDIFLPDGYLLRWIADYHANQIFFPQEDIPGDYAHWIQGYAA